MFQLATEKLSSSFIRARSLRKVADSLSVESPASYVVIIEDSVNSKSREAIFICYARNFTDTINPQFFTARIP